MSSIVSSSTSSDVSVTSPPALTAPPQSATTVDELALHPVVPRRSPARWVASVLVLLLLAQVAHSLATNPFYEWHKFGHWVGQPVILDGLVVTLKITAASAVLSLALGIVIALARLSTSPLLRGLAWGYVWLFRSVPLIVVLLFLFNVSAFYPSLGLGIPFGPQLFSISPQSGLSYEAIGVLGLSVAEAAYASEVVRSGVLSVDQGQLEAAHALGLGRLRTFRRVVLPQALRSIVPSYVNLLIGLIKASSLVFYVSLIDLFGAVQTMASTHPTDIVPLLLVATAWYVAMTSVLSVVQFYVERHYAKGAVRSLPPTPLQRLRSAVLRAVASGSQAPAGGPR